jgi:hypothetical protein
MPLLIAGALMLSAGSAHAKTDPEAQLAKITAGRTAGAPVNCIQQHQVSSTEIINRTAIVYKMDNGTIYVNRPNSGATFLNRSDVMVTNTHSPQLCNVDIVRLVDSSAHMPTGSVGLGSFVPYPTTPLSAARKAPRGQSRIDSHHRCGSTRAARPPCPLIGRSNILFSSTECHIRRR